MKLNENWKFKTLSVDDVKEHDSGLLAMYLLNFSSKLIWFFLYGQPQNSINHTKYNSMALSSWVVQIKKLKHHDFLIDLFSAAGKTFNDGIFFIYVFLLSSSFIHFKIVNSDFCQTINSQLNSMIFKWLYQVWLQNLHSQT